MLPQNAQSVPPPIWHDYHSSSELLEVANHRNAVTTQLFPRASSIYGRRYHEEVINHVILDSLIYVSRQIRESTCWEMAVAIIPSMPTGHSLYVMVTHCTYLVMLATDYDRWDVHDIAEVKNISIKQSLIIRS